MLHHEVTNLLGKGISKLLAVTTFYSPNRLQCLRKLQIDDFCTFYKIAFLNDLFGVLIAFAGCCML